MGRINNDQLYPLDVVFEGTETLAGSDSDGSTHQYQLNSLKPFFTAPFIIQDEGITLPARTTLNFIGAGVTAVDNNSEGRTDITISGGTSSVAWGDITGTLSNQTDLQTALDAKYDASNPDGYITGITVQDEATPLTQRPTLNFIGAGVTAVDNSGQSRIDITIPGGGGLSQTTISQTPTISTTTNTWFTANPATASIEGIRIGDAVIINGSISGSHISPTIGTDYEYRAEVTVTGFTPAEEAALAVNFLSNTQLPTYRHVSVRVSTAGANTRITITALVTATGVNGGTGSVNFSGSFVVSSS